MEEDNAQCVCKLVFANSPNPVIILDPFSAKIVECNPATEKVTGLTRMELLGANIFDLVPREDRGSYEAILKEHLAKGGVKEYRAEYAAKDGRRIPLLVTSFFINSGGKTLIALMFDVIEQIRKTELTLEREHKLIIENIRQGLCLTSKGILLSVNKAMCEIFGYTQSELIGTPAWNLAEPNIRKKIKELFFRKAAQNDSSPEVIPCIRNDGSKLMAEITISQIDGGNFICLVSDVTQRTKEEFDKLAKAQEQLLSAQRNAHIGSWELDLKTNSVTCSDEVYSIFAIPKNSKSVYDTFFKVIHPEDQPKVSSAISNALNKQIPYNLDFRLILANGKERVVNSMGKVVFDDAGKPLRMYGTIQDITDRKKLEDELNNYLFVIDQSLTQVALADMDGYIVFSNKSWEEAHGYTKQELLGKHLSMFHRKEDLLKVANFNRILLQEGRNSGEVIHKRKDGTVYTAYMQNFILKVGGQPKYLVGVATDITERKKQELELAKLSQVVESVDEAIALIDHKLNGLLVYVNPAWERLFGYRKSEVIGKRKALMLDALEKDPPLFSKFKKCLEHKTPFAAEMQWVKKDGSLVDLNVLSQPIFDKDRKLMVWCNILRDITAKKKNEMAIRESEERFRKIFESGSIGVSLVDLTGHFIKANPKMCNILGYKQKELEGISFAEVTHPEERARDLGRIKKLLAKKVYFYEFEKRYVRKDGTIIWCKIHTSVVRNPEGHPLYFLTLTENIDRRKKAEQALSQYRQNLEELVEKRTEELSNQRSFLESIINNTPALIFVKNAKTFRFELMNSRCEQFLRVKHGSLLGKTDYDVFPKMQADVLRLKDLEVLRSLKPAEMIEELIDERGQKSYLRTRKLPILGKDGKPEYLLGIGEDISRIKELDILKSHFISSISHELRSPITPIKAQTQRLLDVGKEMPCEDRERCLSIVLRNTIRLDRLIQDILEINRIQSGRLSIFKKYSNINQIIQAAIVDLESVILTTDTHVYFSPVRFPKVKLDRDRLIEVMINLLDNSIKYGRGEVFINVSRTGKNVIVSIKDDGIGIIKKDLPFIFDPFYRANISRVLKYEGTGLGLSIVKGIVEAHGGKIWAESKFNKWTKITFSLPID